MAIYKYDAYVRKHAADPAFDGEHRPGATAPLSGIYRCLGCGREDISKEGESTSAAEPPPAHDFPGAIRWRLAVFADHRPKD